MGALSARPEVLTERGAGFLEGASEVSGLGTNSPEAEILQRDFALNLNFDVQWHPTFL